MPEPKNNKLAVLHYQQAVSNKISRLLTKYNIKMVHISKKKNRQLLRTVKDDLGLKIPGVYHIPCECGKVHIGQTGRSTEARCKEHMRHIQLDQPEKSVVVEHSIRIHGLPCQGSHPNKTQPQKLQQGQWLHTEPGLEPHNKVVQT
jgi:hypothetical protein